MSDEVDRGNDRAEEILEDALKVRRPEGPPPCGYCYNCSEFVGPEERWCGIECRDDYEKMIRMRKQRGEVGDE